MLSHAITQANVEVQQLEISGKEKKRGLCKTHVIFIYAFILGTFVTHHRCETSDCTLCMPSWSISSYNSFH